ncbi:uncharacterized protein MKK02DRAFT_32948 [Dioszegia hungarica]|uniref:Uncharacterized protein n=1 Tax=Dioszegia hungarica TaxID=4972 RepID=A0AA38H7E3_9TREE|nr:uncharacterized protein MKK02DRAFT_32948 [Dioszegia hungarica]KAI9635558.1 hypothetical protein MKK02DRAFT_32948 [Dioszegia hungarica]
MHLHSAFVLLPSKLQHSSLGSHAIPLNFLRPGPGCYLRIDGRLLGFDVLQELSSHRSIPPKYIKGEAGGASAPRPQQVGHTRAAQEEFWTLFRWCLPVKFGPLGDQLGQVGYIPRLIRRDSSQDSHVLDHPRAMVFFGRAGMHASNAGKWQWRRSVPVYLAQGQITQEGLASDERTCRECRPPYVDSSGLFAPKNLLALGVVGQQQNMVFSHVPNQLFHVLRANRVTQAVCFRPFLSLQVLVISG